MYAKILTPDGFKNMGDIKVGDKVMGADGEYICVALRNVVFMYFKKHKNIYGFRSDEMVRIYFPELEEKISMATEPEETRTFYGWFGCISPETKEVRLNIVKDIIKELE